jgi:apolipoprotein D and lipocalin family protein
MEKFGFVKQILRSSTFLGQSIQKQEETLNRILETKEITRDELLDVIDGEISNEKAILGKLSSIDREELIDDIERVSTGSMSEVKAVAKKYDLGDMKADDIIDYLQQFTSYINPKQIPYSDDVELQEDFDLESYMGLWYNAGRIPQPFDRNTPWETAEYQLLNAQMVKVINTAYNEDDSLRGEIVGTAEVVNSNQPAALYVSFPTGQPRPNKIVPNYLIHNTDYNQYSIVGSYDKSNLYILVRQRPFSREFYENLLVYVESLGYDLSQIVECYGSLA